MEGQRYVAVVGCQHYFGGEILKPGQCLRLVKDPDNRHDSEAIRVELAPVGKVGYRLGQVRPQFVRGSAWVYERRPGDKGGQ